jgi:hypothetical protein
MTRGYLRSHMKELVKLRVLDWHISLESMDCLRWNQVKA